MRFRAVMFGAAAAAIAGVSASAARQAAPGAPPAAAASTATATTAAAAAAPTGPRPMAESVAAVVNGEIISTYDLRQRVQLLIASSGVQPSAENLSALEREALRSLIDEHLELAEVREVAAKQKGLNLMPTDKEIDQELNSVASQFHMTGAQFLKSLSNVGISPATLRQQVSAQYAWQRYIGSRFHDTVHVGDEQVNAYLARFNADAAKPQYEVSEVFLDAQRAGGAQEAMEGAKQLVEQIRQGAPFAAVAHQFSSLPSAANGGDEGWLIDGQIQPELQATLRTMRPGTVSDPIPVKDGVYILELRNKRSGGTGSTVRLQQAAVRVPANATPAEVADATGKLEKLRAEAPTCDTLSSAAAAIPGVAASGDLGETSEEDLSPEFKAVVDQLKPGQVGGPVRTTAGLNLVVLCSKRAGGASEPTRAQVENRLYGDQITMIARRYLRDLRNSATIESR